MLKGIWRRLRRFMPEGMRRAMDSWSISRRFRNRYLRWRIVGGRSFGMADQALLRETFVANGFQDLDWAAKIEKRDNCGAAGLPGESMVKTGHLESAEITNAVKCLREEGVWVCPKPLPKDWVSRVREALAQLPAEGKGRNDDVQCPVSINPKAATYWHRQADLEENADLVGLIKDPSILEVIRQYLGCEPVYDMCAAWWSYPAKADSASAQLFHFDLDRVRWLKVFVYLTDVGPDNGPHMFVRGSHRTVGARVRRDGRFSDEETSEIFPDHEVAMLTGAAGTLFIEDTLGFHKGQAVEKGQRCVFEFEYSMSHFGYPYPSSRLDLGSAVGRKS